MPVLTEIDAARQEVTRAENRVRFVENEIAAGRIRGPKKIAEACKQLETARQQLAQLEAHG